MGLADSRRFAVRPGRGAIVPENPALGGKGGSAVRAAGIALARVRHVRALLSLAALIAGCAGRTIEWTKAGATPAQYDRDNRICSERAEAAAKSQLGGRN